MPITVRLSPDEELRLTNLAAKTGRKISFYVKHAVSEYLEDMEDLFLAEQELIKFRDGRSTSMPLEEVMKRYEVAH